MRTLLLLLLFPLLASAKELPVWNADIRKAWWTRHGNPADWQRMARETNTRLIAAHKAMGTDKAMSDRAFLQWMGHMFWLEAYTGYLGKNEQTAYRKMALEPELPWIFLAAASRHDDLDAAMQILCRIYDASPEACRAYAHMAVAIALVWDQSLPDGWPHPFVARKAIPIGDSDPVQRFKFFVHSHQKKKLLHDPRKLSVHELVFMVDSPLMLREVITCQGISLRRPENLAKLYRSVDYNYRRVTKNETMWISEPYRVATIAKHGGICADQAYLVSQTGKAHGVPSILFFGQGDSGAHAWVGYLEEKGEWHFNVARYRGERYPVGQAYHPQTRKRISDYELAAFNHHNDKNPAFRTTRLMVDWARRNEDQPFYAELVLLARKHLPYMMETWTMEDDWHWKNGKNPERHAAFLHRWISFFEKAPATKFEGQKRLLTLYREHNMKRDAEKLENQIMKETSSTRFDLSIHLAAENILHKASNGQWESAEDELGKRMNDFRSRSGGHLFYGLLQPYVMTCVEERQYSRARKAMQYTRRFDARGTVLGNDIKTLGDLVARMR